MHDEKQMDDGAAFGGTQLSAHFRMREKDSETGSDAKFRTPMQQLRMKRDAISWCFDKSRSRHDDILRAGAGKRGDLYV